jgi:hypothetical protein
MPIIMVVVTLASRKWGNQIGGLLAAIPWVAGPVLLFMTLEQGVPFVINALPGTICGSIGWLVFSTTFILIGRNNNAFISLLSGYLGYIVMAILLKNIIPHVNIHIWYIVCTCLLVLSLNYFPKVPNDGKDGVKVMKHELLLRVLMITSFVILITHFANLLGPGWSGLLTPFPVMTAVLAVFVHYTQGNYQVRSLLLGMMIGSLGFVTFLYSLYFLLPYFSTTHSFLIATLINVSFIYGMSFIQRRKDLVK